MVVPVSLTSTDGSLSYLHIASLTLEAVLQTVIVCLFGFVAATTGLLSPEGQKQLSKLNVQIFTPCLVFAKLGSSLSLQALVDIAVIPVFFVITTAVSLGVARLTSLLLRLNTPESNFVTAMSVFGNSNSLPVSLTVALAYTLPDLTWPDLPNDNKDDVASRGILYLLIFQQLGQILRWSWGYNTLLAKPDLCSHHEALENGSGVNDGDIESHPAAANEADTDDPSQTLLSGNRVPEYVRESSEESSEEPHLLSTSTRSSSSKSLSKIVCRICASSAQSIASSPVDGSAGLSGWQRTGNWLKSAYAKFMSFMNPPLWAMFVAILVAAFPKVQAELFRNGGFVENTVGSAVKQLGNLAIPLILVVLGSNLAPNDEVPPPSKNYKKIVFASLLSRMVLPAAILLPLIALSVKYIKISILDDPIFLLVAFILTVAPPAIQLSQICQLNQVFEREMSGVLFWGYVILTLPSTILIVVTSLKVIDWAGTTRT